MTKTTVRFDPETWREGRIRALDEGVSFQELLQRALKLYLKSPAKKRGEGKA